MGADLFTALVIIVIGLAIFLLLRAVMLWYWKIDTIVDRLESISLSTHDLNEANRKQSRINFYKAKALGNKQGAYESLLEIVFDELLAKGFRNEDRQQRYNELKTKHELTFQKLGYEFPEYSILFS